MLTVRLAHGLWEGEACHREAVLAAPGWEAVPALDAAGSLPAAAWATRVLAACLAPMGARSPAQAAADLTAGDRATLLWSLHGLLTEGDAAARALLVDCTACGERLELEGGPATLEPPAGTPTPRPWHEADVEGVRVRFRLPAGADLEAAAAVGPEGGAAALLERIVLAQDGPVAPATLEARLSEEVEALDPCGELLLALTCEACGHPGEALLDPVVHVQADLQRLAERQAWDIHCLARHYHWSERDILALPPERRARYLALVAAEAP